MGSENFTSNPIITRPLPNGVVYDLSHPSQTTITLPPGSTWSSGLHWHERHDEYLRLVQGTIKVSLNGRERVISASTSKSHSDPVVKVERYVRHEWSRADSGLDPEAEPVIVVESTDPTDDEKHLFFWNLNGAILHDQTRPGSWTTKWLLWLRMMVIFRALDNYPVIGVFSASQSRHKTGLKSLMEWILTHVLLTFAAIVGKITGIATVDKEYTPRELLERWEKSTLKQR